MSVRVPTSDGEAYPSVTRLDSLDLLRGFCALAVAVFHFDTWGGLGLPTGLDGFMAVCGTYGVSVFFILSGYSLAHAYADRFDTALTAGTLVRYASRRAGRLLPLFGIVVLASLAGKLLSGKPLPDLLTIGASLSLLFGFVNPADTPVIGGWSIGVEVVFYVLFPLLLVSRQHLVKVLAVTLFMALWLDRTLSAGISLEQNWAVYVAPANQAFFFVAGVLAGVKLRESDPDDRLISRLIPIAIVVAAAVASYGANDLMVVTGARRLLLSVMSVALVVAMARIRLRGGSSLVASISGGASYPLYLIHPLVFFLASRFIASEPLTLFALLAVAVLLSIFIDLLIDKPLQKRIKAAGW